MKRDKNGRPCLESTSNKSHGSSNTTANHAQGAMHSPLKHKIYPISSPLMFTEQDLQDTRLLGQITPNKILASHSSNRNDKSRKALIGFSQREHRQNTPSRQYPLQLIKNWHESFGNGSCYKATTIFHRAVGCGFNRNQFTVNKIDCKKYKKSKTISSARNIEAKKNKNDLQREVTLTQIPIVYPDNKLEIPNPNRHLSKLLGFEQSFQPHLSWESLSENNINIKMMMQPCSRVQSTGLGDKVEKMLLASVCKYSQMYRVLKIGCINSNPSPQGWYCIKKGQRFNLRNLSNNTLQMSLKICLMK